MSRWPGCCGTAGSVSAVSWRVIFADLIIVPILLIYRKYYGTKMMLFILATFYATMAAAGYLIELIFGGLASYPPAGTPRWPRLHPVELHHCPQHHLPDPRRRTVLPVSSAPAASPCSKMMGGAPSAADGQHDHHAHTGH